MNKIDVIFEILFLQKMKIDQKHCRETNKENFYLLCIHLEIKSSIVYFYMNNISHEKIYKKKFSFEKNVKYKKFMIIIIR